MIGLSRVEDRDDHVIVADSAVPTHIIVIPNAESPSWMANRTIGEFARVAVAHRAPNDWIGALR